MTAPSSRSSARSLWVTWRLIHHAWFGEEVPPLPLTREKLLGAAAAFKAGRYRSYGAYASKAKEHHILAGFDWSEALAMTIRKTTMSVTRGLGQSRQAAPFDLDRALAVADQVPRQIAGPIGWQSLLAVGVGFIMREIEVAFARVRHLTFDTANRTVVLQLPATKKDPRAIGCSRSMVCTCRPPAERRADCVYCAAWSQAALVRERFGPDLPEDMPLFPTAAGRDMDKTAVIKMLRANVELYGGTVQAEGGMQTIGGHSLRVTGAQRLAALGVDSVKIMVLARWAGPTILRYVREAPLQNLPREVRDLEGRTELTQIASEVRQQIVEARAAQTAVRAEAARIRRETEVGPVIMKSGRACFKAHVVLIGAAGVPPREWTTKCGLSFGLWHYTSHRSSDAIPHELLCGKCFESGERQGTQARTTQMARTISSSSTSTTSEADDA